MKARPRTATVRNKRVSNSRQRRQQHLLDVKVRSRKATQQRNRRFLVFFSKIALALILCVGLYMGVREGARRLFFENPDYQLRQIEVKTDGTLQREQILQAAALQEGENIFRINLQSVHDALQELPQVDEVQVARQMPGEIDIRIIERKPVAWITSAKEIADPFASDAAFLVDARGVLMREKKLLPEYLGLPVITGCRNESFEAGSAVQSFEARAALELLRLSSGSFMQTRFQIREIDVSSGYSLVVTDKDHTRVTFGYDQMLSQLRRLEQFLVYADDSNRELQTVNLLVQRNIPVTFAEPPAEVINETIDPEGEGPKRIMKATPVFPLPAPSRTPAPGKKAERKKPVTIRRAEPVQTSRAVPVRSDRKN
jgi:cell division protein FtsQ